LLAYVEHADEKHVNLEMTILKGKSPVTKTLQLLTLRRALCVQLCRGRSTRERQTDDDGEIILINSETAIKVEWLDAWEISIKGRVLDAWHQVFLDEESLGNVLTARARYQRTSERKKQVRRPDMLKKTCNVVFSKHRTGKLTTMALKTAVKRNKYTYLLGTKASYTSTGSMGEVQRLGSMLVGLYAMAGHQRGILLLSILCRFFDWRLATDADKTNQRTKYEIDENRVFFSR
jgi:hypothetical protein